MLVFNERGKPEYPEKNFSEQSREPKKKLRRNSVLHSSQVSPLRLLRRSSRNFNIPPVPFEAFKILNNGHWGIWTFEDWSALNAPFLPHGSGFEIVRSCCSMKVCRSRGTKGTHVSLTRGFYKSSGKFFKSSLLQGTLSVTDPRSYKRQHVVAT